MAHISGLPIIAVPGSAKLKKIFLSVFDDYYVGSFMSFCRLNRALNCEVKGLGYSRKKNIEGGVNLLETNGIFEKNSCEPFRNNVEYRFLNKN